MDDGFWDLADKAISLLLKNPQTDDDRRTINRLFEEQQHIIEDYEKRLSQPELRIPLQKEG